MYPFKNLPKCFPYYLMFSLEYMHDQISVSPQNLVMSLFFTLAILRVCCGFSVYFPNNCNVEQRSMNLFAICVIFCEMSLPVFSLCSNWIVHYELKVCYMFQGLTLLRHLNYNFLIKICSFPFYPLNDISGRKNDLT